MRIAILMGLVFIGDSIGASFGADYKGDPTKVIGIVFGICLVMDAIDIFKRIRE